MDWLFDAARSVLLGWVPGWLWIVAAGVAMGWAWKVFGWQGVVGGLLAVLTLGAYRQGWRDRGQGKPSIPTLPIEDYEQELAPPPKRRKIRTVMDILNGR